MSDWEIIFLGSVKLVTNFWPLVVFAVGWMVWEWLTDPYTRNRRPAKD